MGLLRAFVGYKNDQHVAAPRRAVLRGAFITGVVLVIAIARLAFASSPLGSVRVIRSLDEHTRRHDPDAANTIPSFVALPGALGIVAAGGRAEMSDRANATSAAHVVVNPLNESELLKGFCTARLSHLVRQQYPGSYEDMGDAELEQRVLEKRPQYRDKLCVLPAWVDAAPEEIVKYEVISPAAAAFDPEGWLRAAIAAAVFAFVALNVYYRLIVGQFAPAEPDPVSTHS